MRILAIRGSNLASLAGDFDVDFANGPLGDAGIFAITGPTGAYKQDRFSDAFQRPVPQIPFRAQPGPGRLGAPDGQLRRNTVTDQLSDTGDPSAGGIPGRQRADE